MRTHALAVLVEVLGIVASYASFALAADSSIFRRRLQVPLSNDSLVSNGTDSNITQLETRFKLVLLIPILIGVCILLVVAYIGLCYRRKLQRRQQTRELFVDSPHSLRLDFVTHDLQEHYAVTPGSFLPLSPRRSTLDVGQVLGNAEESTRYLLALLESKELAGKRIPFERLQVKSAISKGASGEIWLCKYVGQDVAVKRLLRSKDQTVENVREFAEEIALSAILRHPHIVAFIGVAWSSLENLSMVMEFCPMGDLKRCLADNGHLLSWSRDKFRMAVGIARGLQYIHNRETPIIHRDLKSKNILLTETLEVKIIDFGASRSRSDGFMTSGVGTPFWTAPEILEGNQYSEQADIYSFGVVLSELDTCKMPFFDVRTDEGKKPKPFQILQWVLDDKLCPTFSEDCPKLIRDVGTACLSHDPDRRPRASQLAQLFSSEMRQRVYTL